MIRRSRFRTFWILRFQTYIHTWQELFYTMIWSRLVTQRFENRAFMSARSFRASAFAGNGL